MDLISKGLTGKIIGNTELFTVVAQNLRKYGSFLCLPFDFVSFSVKHFRASAILFPYFCDKVLNASLLKVFRASVVKYESLLRLLSDSVSSVVKSFHVSIVR